MANKTIDSRNFWQTKTFWGCALVALSGALEALGYSGSVQVLSNLALALGLPFTVYGVSDRLRK